MQQDAHGQHMSGIFIHQLRTLPIHKAEGEGKKVPKLLSEIGQVDEQCDQQPERSRMRQPAYLKMLSAHHWRWFIIARQRPTDSESPLDCQAQQEWPGLLCRLPCFCGVLLVSTQHKASASMWPSNMFHTIHSSMLPPVLTQYIQ